MAEPRTYPGGHLYPGAATYPGVYSGVDPSPATYPEQSLARDLAATVAFVLPAGFGYRIERAAGAGQTPPRLPGAGGAWTAITADADHAGGATTVTVTVPANDSDYTVAVWASDTDGAYAEPVAVNVFGLDEPVIGPAGTLYASVQVTTNRAGWPRLELDGSDTFPTPTVFDGYDDHTVWTICDTTGEVTADTGDPMPSTGFPAGSSGKYLRVEIPSALGNRWVRGYQASDSTP